MPRTCTVCVHPERGEIDAALIRGVSPYQLEATYSDLTRESIKRHKESDHIPSKLLKAHAVEEVTAADVLLEDIASIRSAAFRALDRAEEAGDMNTLLRAIREARENVRLLGELRGRLNSGTTINIIQNPQWLELRAVIVGALEPHPDAKRAVVEALEGAGDG
jgi:hypothetical protein